MLKNILEKNIFSVKEYCKNWGYYRGINGILSFADESVRILMLHILTEDLLRKRSCHWKDYSQLLSAYRSMRPSRYSN